jgi:hypothetical protein
MSVFVIIASPEKTSFLIPISDKKGPNLMAQAQRESPIFMFFLDLMDKLSSIMVCFHRYGE